MDEKMVVRKMKKTAKKKRNGDGEVLVWRRWG